MILTIRQLEVLVAAADTASFSEAAQLLGISQPSLSETIRRMEAETGLRLFDRSTRSVALTSQGRHAVAVAREMLRDFRRGMEAIGRSDGRQRAHLTIAGLPSIACAILPTALRRFLAAFPDVEVSVHDLLHERAVARIEEGQADLALTIRPARLGNCRFEELGADILQCVCAPDHPLAAADKVTWSDLAPYPFVGLARNSSVRRMTDAAFVNCGVFVEPAYELEQIPSALALVEAGLGVSALPALTLTMTRGADIVAKPLSEPQMQRRLGVLTSRRPRPDYVTGCIAEIRKVFMRHQMS
jgi:LysR family transcriptional regulator, carnitine catabolism transcriptional activator